VAGQWIIDVRLEEATVRREELDTREEVSY
jgi:hypothetical protein